MYCIKCGQDIGDSKVCPNCGTKSGTNRASGNKIIVVFLIMVIAIIAIVFFLFPKKRNESINVKNQGTSEAKEAAYTATGIISIGGSELDASDEILFCDAWEHNNNSFEMYGFTSRSKKTGNQDGVFLTTVVKGEDGEWHPFRVSSRMNAVHEITKEDIVNFKEECNSTKIVRSKQDTSTNTEASLITESDQTSDNEPLDLPDPEQIEYDNSDNSDDFSSENVKNNLPGYYVSDEDDELYITDNGDGTFNIDLSVYRLAGIEDPVASFNQFEIDFCSLAPDGETYFKGYIEFGSTFDEIRAVITESEWEYIESGYMINLYRKN